MSLANSVDAKKQTEEMTAAKSGAKKRGRPPGKKRGRPPGKKKAGKRGRPPGKKRGRPAGKRRGRPPGKKKAGKRGRPPGKSKSGVARGKLKAIGKQVARTQKALAKLAKTVGALFK